MVCTCWSCLPPSRAASDQRRCLRRRELPGHLIGPTLEVAIPREPLHGAHAMYEPFAIVRVEQGPIDLVHLRPGPLEVSLALLDGAHAAFLGRYCAFHAATHRSHPPCVALVMVSLTIRPIVV